MLNGSAAQVAARKTRQGKGRSQGKKVRKKERREMASGFYGNTIAAHLPRTRILALSNTIHSPSIGSILGHRRRRWSNIDPAMGVVFAGLAVDSHTL